MTCGFVFEDFSYKIMLLQSPQLRGKFLLGRIGSKLNKVRTFLWAKSRRF